MNPVTDADLAGYRSHNSIGDTLDRANQAAGHWLRNNWEYVAGGAAIVAGGVLIATGVGGPLGMMLVSAGADTIIQKATTGDVNWTEVGVSFAAGAVGGGFATTKLGLTGVRAAAAAGSVSGGVGGASLGGYQYLANKGPHTIGGLLNTTAREGASGAIWGGMGGAAGHEVTALGGRALDHVHFVPEASRPTSQEATMASKELVRFDPEFASRQLLGQAGSGYARTPGGRTLSFHAAQRIVMGGAGRGPTTLERVDDVLDHPTGLRYRPDTNSLRVMQGRKDFVAISLSAPGQHIATVMLP